MQTHAVACPRSRPDTLGTAAHGCRWSGRIARRENDGLMRLRQCAVYVLHLQAQRTSQMS